MIAVSEQMRMRNLRSLLHLLILSANIVITTQITSSRSHAALFLFGDSFLDAGNNNYVNAAPRANFFPFGQTFFRYPTGRNSDGRIIPDFICKYMNIPLILPYLHPWNDKYTDGANFASAGAGALDGTLQGKTISLKTQVGYFKKVKAKLRKKMEDEEIKELLSKAIFLFSIGTNDYSVQFSTNSTTLLLPNLKQEYVGMVIGNLTGVINELYKSGGRKFGFLNVAPLGCLPLMRNRNNGNCINEVNDVIKMHNNELDKVLNYFHLHFHDFHYFNFDFYNSLCQRINEPSTYGFKEVKRGCCGVGEYRGLHCGEKQYELCHNSTEYLFFDSHPTDKANRQIAKQMWSGNSHKFTNPPNLKRLLAI